MPWRCVCESRHCARVMSYTLTVVEFTIRYNCKIIDLLRHTAASEIFNTKRTPQLPAWRSWAAVELHLRHQQVFPTRPCLRVYRCIQHRYSQWATCVPDRNVAAAVLAEYLKDGKFLSKRKSNMKFTIMIRPLERLHWAIYWIQKTFPKVPLTP